MLVPVLRTAMMYVFSPCEGSGTKNRIQAYGFKVNSNIVRAGEREHEEVRIAAEGRERKSYHLRTSPCGIQVWCTLSHVASGGALQSSVSSISRVCVPVQKPTKAGAFKDPNRG